MHYYLGFLWLWALVACVVNAAPIARTDVHKFRVTQGVSELSRRTHLIPVGPGTKHPEDDLAHSQHGTALGFTPMLPGTYVKTHNRIYSHKEVNEAAHRLVNQAIPGAPTYTTNRIKKGTRTYPKASSGFRPSEHMHDPASGHQLTYHYPFHGRPGTPHQNPQGQNSMRVGSDRIMAWRNPGETHFKIGVSYHDPKRPIPNNPNARNHPFSHAPVRQGNAVKVQALKAKKAVQRGWRKLRGNQGH